MPEEYADYHVVWEIDVSATSHRDAAEKAQDVQRDRRSWAGVFDVAREGDAEIVRVDLDDPGGP